MVLFEPGGRNARHESIRIEWKSGDVNSLGLLRQEGVECRSVENVQRAGTDAGFPWREPRRREAAFRETGGNGFRGEQQDLFECAQRQITNRLEWPDAIQVSQYRLPLVVGEGGSLCHLPPTLNSYACCIAFARMGSFQPGRMKWQV